MLKYGLSWPDVHNDLSIELSMVRNKGYISGFGNGHTFHYKAACRLIWPELDTHRWSDLAAKEITRVNHKITSFMGPGSTAKTHEAAKWGLIEYFADPENTCVLVSSTDIRGLKLRIWGEITDLWQKAINLWPQLPGHSLESRIAITTDALEDGDLSDRQIRDMRKAICGIPCIQDKKYVGLAKYHGIKQKRMRLIADECFPAGTLVDTVSGRKPIESIVPGDWVISSTGINSVRACSSKLAAKLLRVLSKDGRVIICTPDHPFLTQKGWVKACNLNQHHFMLGAYETMCVLRGHVPTTFQQQGVLSLQGEDDVACLQRLRETISSETDKRRCRVLRSSMREPGASERPRVSQEVLHGNTLEEDLEHQKRILQGSPGGKTKAYRCYSGKIQTISGILNSGAEDRCWSRNQREDEGFGCQAENSRWQRNWTNEGRVATVEDVPECDLEPSGKDRNECGERLSDLLQTGHRLAAFKVGNRSGRGNSHELEQSKIQGREEAEILRGSWVDHIEVAQPGDFGFPLSGEDSRGCRVYNLEIDGHPSYSVNGVIVHNCALMGASFLKSIANLNNNTDFQVVACFNPNDTLDPGGQISEPVDGWQSHMEPTKTEVWDTRFMSGRCINFVGTDSPNFDDPDQPNKYPYLIGPRKIAELVSAFGKDSFEYYSQGVGVMKVGQLSHRVVTRDLCRKNHALEQPEWKDANRTRIYGLDSAYGGDRCVGGWGEFGYDPDGKQILCLHKPRTIHITTDDEPENIIARSVKEECEGEEITPENMFHDSTGRGRLGTALARIWSPQTNPIEFGGSATDRPVSLDIYTTDPTTREKRLLLCSEHYDRFVTELWFSVAYAIEGGQIRGLPEDVMDELCMRMWSIKKGNKKSVEPKSGTPTTPGMKERTGRSPDLGDWCAVVVEGARRRGFQIARLGNSQSYNEGFNWLTDKVNQHRTLLRSKMLATR